MRFKTGDFVKYGHPKGSVGQIVKLNHYGGYYVEWVYGRNVAGEIMSSSLSSCEDKELMLVTEKEYLQARDRQGHGDSK